MKNTIKPAKTVTGKVVHKKYSYIIGIDSGVNTGFAVWDVEHKCLLEVGTYMIHEAMTKVKQAHEFNVVCPIKVRVEDARKRTWFGNAGRESLQGAGSIKRDAKIWEDFLKDMGIDYEMVAPKNNRTKMDADYFKKVTKWEGRTNQHSRDATMLVFGM